MIFLIAEYEINVTITRNNDNVIVRVIFDVDFLYFAQYAQYRKERIAEKRRPYDFDDDKNDDDDRRQIGISVFIMTVR